MPAYKAVPYMMIVNSNKLFINSLESNINKNYNIKLKNNYLSATNFKSVLDHFFMVLSAVKSLGPHHTESGEASREK